MVISRYIGKYFSASRSMYFTCGDCRVLDWQDARRGYHVERQWVFRTIWGYIWRGTSQGAFWQPVSRPSATVYTKNSLLPPEHGEQQRCRSIGFPNAVPMVSRRRRQRITIGTALGLIPGLFGDTEFLPLFYRRPRWLAVIASVRQSISVRVVVWAIC